MLHTISHGTRRPGIPPALIVHGLYGSARNWGVIAKRLSSETQVVAVDMRNHGQSPHLPSHSYTDMAADLAAVIEHLGAPAAVIGHSMGGKASMVLSLTRPELVSRLLVADIAPVTYSHTQLPFIRAMQAVDVGAVTTRGDVDAQLATSVDDPTLRSFFTQSFDLASRSWRLNLDVLAAEMDKIIGFPEISGVYTGPTLFLSGADSDYVTRDHRPTITGLFPSARFAKIPGAGHWLHAEKPREFEAAARAFLLA